jgi:hypothetical protein
MIVLMGEMVKILDMTTSKQARLIYQRIELNFAITITQVLFILKVIYYKRIVIKR